MKTRMVLCGIALVGVTMLVTAQVMSQEKKGREPPKPKGAADEMNEMMAKWQELARPGASHRQLNVLAGTWDAQVRFWMSPDQPPQESKGVMERKWVLGRRFLLEEYEETEPAAGPMAHDEPFEGLGLVGYDNLKKKYTAAWADTMSTMIATSLGTSDVSGKAFTFVGEHDDPMTGGKKKVREVIRVISPNKHTLAFFETGPDGKEFKNLEVVFTRR